jgi:hypothetical protein
LFDKTIEILPNGEGQIVLTAEEAEKIGLKAGQNYEIELVINPDDEDDISIEFVEVDE